MVFNKTVIITNLIATTILTYLFKFISGLVKDAFFGGINNKISSYMQDLGANMEHLNSILQILSWGIPLLLAILVVYITYRVLVFNHYRSEKKKRKDLAIKPVEKTQDAPLPATLNRLTKLRTRGVEIKDRGVTRSDLTVKDWFKEVESWLNESITVISEFSVTDAEWFRVIDAVPLASEPLNSTCRVKHNIELHIQRFNEHSFRIKRFGGLLKKYGVGG